MTKHLSQSQKANFRMGIMLTFGEVPLYSDLVASGSNQFFFKIESAEWELIWDEEFGRWTATCTAKGRNDV